MTFKIAFATDDGNSYMEKHFGDALHYDIYEVSQSESTFIKRISNTTEEEDEEIHADPKKAGAITELLKKDGVQVVVSKVFGPNIKRIRKKFVCIFMNDAKIKTSISKLQNMLENISSEWEKGEERNFLNLREKN